MESPHALKQLLASLQVPDALVAALQSAGIDTVPDFAFAYSTTQDLDVFCSDEHAELWETLQPWLAFAEPCIKPSTLLKPRTRHLHPPPRWHPALHSSHPTLGRSTRRRALTQPALHSWLKISNGITPASIWTPTPCLAYASSALCTAGSYQATPLAGYLGSCGFRKSNTKRSSKAAPPRRSALKQPFSAPRFSMIPRKCRLITFALAPHGWDASRQSSATQLHCAKEPICSASRRMIRKFWTLQPKHRQTHRSAPCRLANSLPRTASSGKRFPHSTPVAGHWTTHCTNLPPSVQTSATYYSFVQDHPHRPSARHATPPHRCAAKARQAKARQAKATHRRLSAKLLALQHRLTTHSLTLSSRTAIKPFASAGTKAPALISNANTCTRALTECRTVNPAGRITQRASTAILRNRHRRELRSRPQPGEHGCSKATPRLKHTRPSAGKRTAFCAKRQQYCGAAASPAQLGTSKSFSASTHTYTAALHGKLRH